MITLNKIAVKELAAVDDEFAKQAGGYDSVAKMREAIRGDLIQSRETTNTRQAREKVIDALIAKLELSVPSMLVEAETDDIMQDLSNMLGRERINLNQYLQLMGKNSEQYREEMQPEAERRIKQRRALELLGEQEGMTVTTQEIQAMLDEYSRTGGPRTRLNQLKPSQRLSLERSLLRDKAMSWLTERAITIAPEATADDATTSVADDATTTTVSAMNANTATAAADDEAAAMTETATTTEVQEPAK